MQIHFKRFIFFFVLQLPFCIHFHSSGELVRKKEQNWSICIVGSGFLRENRDSTRVLYELSFVQQRHNNVVFYEFLL